MRKWGQAKQASFFSDTSPMKTNYSEYQQNAEVSGLMQSHFPTEYARDVILNDPGVGFADRVRLIAALDHSTRQTSPTGATTQMGNWLPAAVGAGLGVVGAALTAPIFGLSPLQKKMYGIGAGALGAVLNTYGRD